MPGEIGMGLRVRTNVPSLEVQRNLRKANTMVEQQFAKLSSGKRINRAADDAAGMAIATRLTAHIRGMNQAKRNANDGISMVQTAEGGIGEVSNIVIRMRELAVQAASDTIGNKERSLLNREFQALKTEVDRIADTTTFNGTSLLNGTNPQGVLQFQVGSDAGEENRISFDANEANVRIDHLGLSDADISERDNALETFQSLDESFDNLVSSRAKLGAMQARLTTTVSIIGSQVLNEEFARSVIEDADIAETTATLASQNVIKAGGLATLVQANDLPNGVIRLIG